jgi:hypothetical protein
MDAHVVSPVPKSQGGDKEKEKEKEKEKRRRKRGGRGTHGQAQVRTGASPDRNSFGRASGL